MLRLSAPAKLNLYLRVGSRRLDGYHELETLFERVDLADELTFTPQAQGIVVTCDEPMLDCGSNNLVTKAASLAQQTSSVAQGVVIHLIKRIPIASGLGGGSSDAASTLLGLNQLWNLGLSVARMHELAAQLGSDVPFFIGQTAFAIGRGRGEQCEPLEGALPTLWHVLVVPNARLSTREVYEGLDRSHRDADHEPRRVHGPAPTVVQDLTDHQPSITMSLHALRNGSLGELAKGLYNELQPEAIRRCPVITEIQAHLRDSGCVGVLTSGSGPAVFGLCQGKGHATAVAQRLRQRGSPTWVVRPVKTFAHGSR